MTDGIAQPAPDDFSRAPEAAVFAWLDRQNVAWTNHLHAPTFTVADSASIKTDIAGGHTKNLFMKDKKNNLVLVSAWAQSELPLNRLHKAIGTQRLSFSRADQLWDVLKVTPGSVSAFALIHDANQQVRLVVDKALMQFDVMNFHPLRCDMTTAISRSGFEDYVRSTGRDVEIIDFSELASAG